MFNPLISRVVASCNFVEWCSNGPFILSTGHPSDTYNYGIADAYYGEEIRPQNGIGTISKHSSFLFAYTLLYK